MVEKCYSLVINHMIRAGQTKEVNRASAEWVFIDVGFSQKAASCGLLYADGQPKELSFSNLSSELAQLVKQGNSPLNLLIEAPLSVAFNAFGNPTGRSVERRGAQTRYWYVGLGCCVLVATTYLLSNLVRTSRNCDVRLFEGLASFKPKGARSSHSDDVLRLREAVWKPSSGVGAVVSPENLAAQPSDRLQSAFLVAGMDFGIPPVVMLNG